MPACSRFSARQNVRLSCMAHRRISQYASHKNVSKPAGRVSIMEAWMYVEFFRWCPVLKQGDLSQYVCPEWQQDVMVWCILCYSKETVWSVTAWHWIWQSTQTPMQRKRGSARIYPTWGEAVARDNTGCWHSQGVTHPSSTEQCHQSAYSHVFFRVEESDKYIVTQCWLYLLNDAFYTCIFSHRSAHCWMARCPQESPHCCGSSDGLRSSC